MSVRPISVGEELKGQAQPWVGVFSIFGLSQGALLFLNRFKINPRSNWVASPGTAPVLALYLLGGLVIGQTTANMFFMDR